MIHLIRYYLIQKYDLEYEQIKKSDLSYEVKVLLEPSITDEKIEISNLYHFLDKLPSLFDKFSLLLNSTVIGDERAQIIKESKLIDNIIEIFNTILKVEIKTKEK